MNTRSSGAMATGFIVVLFAVGVGITFGGGVFSVLLGFAGVLAGANTIAAGVLMADVPPPAAPVALSAVGPARFDGALALAAFLRRHLTVVGLLMASSAVTAVSGEVGPVLCFGMFALLLLGLSLINTGALGK